MVQPIVLVNGKDPQPVLQPHGGIAGFGEDGAVDLPPQEGGAAVDEKLPPALVFPGGEGAHPEVLRGMGAPGFAEIDLQPHAVQVGLELVPQQGGLPHAVDEGDGGGARSRGEAEFRLLGRGAVDGLIRVPALRPQHHVAPHFPIRIQPSQRDLRPDATGGQIGPQPEAGDGQGRERLQPQRPHDAVPVGLAVFGELVGPGLPLPQGGIHGVGHPGGGVVHLYGEGMGTPRTAQGRQVIAVGGGIAFLPLPCGPAVHPYPGLFGPLQVEEDGAPLPRRRDGDLPPVGGGAGIHVLPVEVAGGEGGGVVQSLAVLVQGAGKEDGLAGKRRVLLCGKVKLPVAGQVDEAALIHKKDRPFATSAPPGWTGRCVISYGNRITGKETEQVPNCAIEIAKKSLK